MRVSKADFTRETIIANGMIGYLLLVITFFCLNNVGINFIQSSLDAFCFPIIITGGSFLVGTITKKILFKKYRYNDKLKEFSNAKTEVEKKENELTEVNELIDSYIEEIAVDTVKLKELEISLKNANMNEELTNTKSRAISPITDIETKNIPRTRKLTND